MAMGYVNVRQRWMSKLDVKAGCQRLDVKDWMSKIEYQSWIDLRKLDFCRICLNGIGRHRSLVDPYATLAAGLLEPNSLDADAGMLKRL